MFSYQKDILVYIHWIYLKNKQMLHLWPEVSNWKIENSVENYIEDILQTSSSSYFKNKFTSI